MKTQVNVYSVVRTEIICDMSEREKTLDFLYEDGWTILNQGPRQISATECNPNIFHVVAEPKCVRAPSAGRAAESGDSVVGVPVVGGGIGVRNDKQRAAGEGEEGAECGFWFYG